MAVVGVIQDSGPEADNIRVGIMYSPTGWCMKWCVKILIAGLMVYMVTGCGSWRRMPSGPGISQLDYKESCGGCHKLPKPRSRSDEQWQNFMMEHRLVSGHDEETAQLFADYLKEMN